MDLREFTSRLAAGEKTFPEVDLADASLLTVDLREVNLRGARLSRLDLRGANLTRADLHAACLSGVDLRGAHLFMANLSKARLSVVELSGANLHAANLHAADLAGIALPSGSVGPCHSARGQPPRCQSSGCQLDPRRSARGRSARGQPHRGDPPRGRSARGQDRRGENARAFPQSSGLNGRDRVAVNPSGSCFPQLTPLHSRRSRSGRVAQASRRTVTAGHLRNDLLRSPDKGDTRLEDSVPVPFCERSVGPRRHGIAMPSPSVLDVDALIAPIPGDSPAGGSVPFAVREKLEEYRKEVNPNDFAPDDPLRPESAQKADWAAVVRLAQETLTETSKDLLVAARLTEALTREHGFGGLRDGLRLMRRLVAECWVRLNPAIESEDDLEVRARRSTGSTIPTAAPASRTLCDRCPWSGARAAGMAGSSGNNLNPARTASPPPTSRRPSRRPRASNARRWSMT